MAAGTARPWYRGTGAARPWRHCKARAGHAARPRRNAQAGHTRAARMRVLDRAFCACLSPTVAPHPQIDLVKAAAVSTVGPQVQ